MSGDSNAPNQAQSKEDSTLQEILDILGSFAFKIAPTAPTKPYLQAKQEAAQSIKNYCQEQVEASLNKPENWYQNEMRKLCLKEERLIKEQAALNARFAKAVTKLEELRSAGNPAQNTKEQVIAELEKVKQEMQMHTVPEGRHLITRSYLNNSIDFRIKALRKGES